MENFPNNFPNNSHAAKIKKETAKESPETTSEKPAQPGEKKKVEKVVSGKVIQRKPPLGTRLKNMFVNDGGTFGQYLVEKVIVPMAKDMVLSVITQTADGVRQGIEERLFGEVRPRSSRTSLTINGTPRVNYNRYSSPLGRAGRADGPPRVITRRSNEIQDIILDNRDDAEAVIEELQAMADGMGHVTVGDLYTAVGIKPRSTDEEWGWDEALLSRARARQLATREFLLIFPRPIPIEFE